MNKKIKQFNIVIVGTGGQGLITLLQVLAESAMAEGYDLKTSELHGLSQRGGSVEVHVRFGAKIHSPMVPLAEADLILALETQEALRAVKFANARSALLVNKQIIPIPLQKPLAEDEIAALLKKVSQDVSLVPAFDICKEKLGKSVTSGIYLISLASLQGKLPLRPQSILDAIKKVLPKKYLELNIKTFELARQYEERV